MKFSCAFALIFSFFFFSACQSYKKVPYLQDAEVLKQVNTQVSPVQDARLIPGDEVSILVSTSDPVVSQPFNAQGSTFLLDDQGVNPFAPVIFLQLVGYWQLKFVSAS